MSWKLPRSSSGHCATSRNNSRPSALRTARCPPLRSLSVRRVTSIRNGAPLSANTAATRHPAPRRDCRSSRQTHSAPPPPAGDPAIRCPPAPDTGHRAPADTTPATGSAGQVTGSNVAGLDLRHLVLHQLHLRRIASPSAAYRDRCARVSALVLKLFISRKRTRAPLRSRNARICRTMISRKVTPSLHRQETLRLPQPHARSQPAVQLDHHRPRQQLRVKLPARRPRIAAIPPPARSPSSAINPRLPTHQLPVTPRKGPNRRLPHPGRLHLLPKSLKSTHHCLPYQSPPAPANPNLPTPHTPTPSSKPIPRKETPDLRPSNPPLMALPSRTPRLL